MASPIQHLLTLFTFFISSRRTMSEIMAHLTTHNIPSINGKPWTINSATNARRAVRDVTWRKSHPLTIAALAASQEGK